MAKVELKKPIVDQISEELNGAKAAVLVDYRGLTVEQDTELRKQLREAGVVYKVYKNTMINFAVKGTEFEELSKHLEGPTAISFSNDELVEDIKNTMIKTRFRSYPVTNEDGTIAGMISRYHLISNHKKKVIQVDHNERGQSVDGLDEAEILEITLEY